MKHSFLLFCLGLFMVTLSSCSTYVDGGAYVGGRPGYVRPGYVRPAPPRPHYAGYYNNGYHNNYRPNYYRPNYYRPQPRPSAVNARVNARVPLVRANTGLSLF